MSEERIFEKEEREHLAFIEKYIKERLSETGTDLSSLRDYIYEQRRRTWEDFARASEHPEQNMQELTQMALTEQRDVGRYERLEKRRKRLFVLRIIRILPALTSRRTETRTRFISADVRL